MVEEPIELKYAQRRLRSCPRRPWRTKLTETCRLGITIDLSLSQLCEVDHGSTGKHGGILVK